MRPKNEHKIERTVTSVRRLGVSSALISIYEPYKTAGNEISASEISLTTSPTLTRSSSAVRLTATKIKSVASFISWFPGYCSFYARRRRPWSIDKIEPRNALSRSPLLGPI